MGWDIDEIPLLNRLYSHRLMIVQFGGQQNDALVKQTNALGRLGRHTPVKYLRWFTGRVLTASADTCLLSINSNVWRYLDKVGGESQQLCRILFFLVLRNAKNQARSQHSKTIISSWIGSSFPSRFVPKFYDSVTSPGPSFQRRMAVKTWAASCAPAAWTKLRLGIIGIFQWFVWLPE